MSADLQGDFGMWSFHMYLPKLSLEKVHLVLKGLRASWGAARYIMIKALLQGIYEGHLAPSGTQGSWVTAFPSRSLVRPYLYSYGGSGWKWPPGCSSPYSWAPQEAECHHLPPVWGAYGQGQGQGRKTNKGKKEELIYKTLELSKNPLHPYPSIPTKENKLSLFSPSKYLLGAYLLFFFISVLYKSNFILNYLSQRLPLVRITGNTTDLSI